MEPSCGLLCLKSQPDRTEQPDFWSFSAYAPRPALHKGYYAAGLRLFPNHFVTKGPHCRVGTPVIANCKAGILPDAIKGRTGDEVVIPTNVKPQRLRVGNRWGLGIVVCACWRVRPT